MDMQDLRIGRVQTSVAAYNPMQTPPELLCRYEASPWARSGEWSYMHRPRTHTHTHTNTKALEPRISAIAEERLLDVEGDLKRPIMFQFVIGANVGHVLLFWEKTNGRHSQCSINSLNPTRISRTNLQLLSSF